MGILLTVGPLFVLESFEESSRGGAMGVYRTFEASGRTISPFILGIAADIFGLPQVFILASILGIIALLIILILREKT
jgi:MFS family permease